MTVSCNMVVDHMESIINLQTLSVFIRKQVEYYD